MQVQIDTLKKMLEIANPVTAPFEDFDLVVAPFDEAAVFSLDEAVGDFLSPGLEQFQEMIKTLQATVIHLLKPASEFRLGLVLGQVYVEDGGQLFSKLMGLLGNRGMLEEASQDFSFFFVQVFGVLAKGMQTAVEFLIFLFREFFHQTLQFLFSQFVCRLSVMSGDMKTVGDDAHSRNFLSHRFGISFPQITADHPHRLQYSWRNRAEILYHYSFFVSGQHTQNGNFSISKPADHEDRSGGDRTLSADIAAPEFYLPARDRYGSRLPPAQIRDEAFNQILEVTKTEEEKALLILQRKVDNEKRNSL